MDTGFKNPIERKQGRREKSPWNFKAPAYDERTSCYVSAGSNYGVGFKQPVGHKGNPSKRADTLPYGRVDTLQTSYAPPQELDPEFIE